MSNLKRHEASQCGAPRVADGWRERPLIWLELSR